MSTNDFDELRSVSLFRLMKAEEILAIGNILVSKEYSAGSRVFAQGEPGNTMYIIRSGEIAILVERNDKPIEVARFGPTNFFGEIALFDRLERTGSATVLQDARLWEFHRDSFAELMSREPYVGIKIMFRIIQDLGRRLRAMDQQI